jgi:hypothetical protein
MVCFTYKIVNTLHRDENMDDDDDDDGTAVVGTSHIIKKVQ